MSEEATPSDMFWYAVVSLGILFLFTRVLHVGLGHIAAIIVIVIVIYIIHTQSTQSLRDFNTELEYRYLTIGQPSAMYISPDLINLFYAINSWSQLNGDSYTKMIEAANNVCQIYLDSENELDNCGENYDVATEQAQNSLNYLQSFTYTLDHPVLLNQLKSLLPKLQNILNSFLVEIKRRCNAQLRRKGISRDQKIISQDLIKPWDASLYEFGKGFFNLYPNQAS